MWLNQRHFIEMHVLFVCVCVCLCVHLHYNSFHFIWMIDVKLPWYIHCSVQFSSVHLRWMHLAFCILIFFLSFSHHRFLQFTATFLFYTTLFFLFILNIFHCFVGLPHFVHQILHLCIEIICPFCGEFCLCNQPTMSLCFFFYFSMLFFKEIGSYSLMFFVFFHSFVLNFSHWWKNQLLISICIYALKIIVKW